MKNYLWNMFANIKNGQLIKLNNVTQTRKKICVSFLKILWTEGFILGYKINAKNTSKLQIFLKYNQGRPAINSIKLISKPGRRTQYTVKQIWKIDSQKSFIIFSTNQGFKSIIDCKKLGLGGEPYIAIS